MSVYLVEKSVVLQEKIIGEIGGNKVDDKIVQELCFATNTIEKVENLYNSCSSYNKKNEFYKKILDNRVNFAVYSIMKSSKDLFDYGFKTASDFTDIEFKYDKAHSRNYVKVGIDNVHLIIEPYNNEGELFPIEEERICHFIGTTSNYCKKLASYFLTEKAIIQAEKDNFEVSVGNKAFRIKKGVHRVYAGCGWIVFIKEA